MTVHGQNADRMGKLVVLFVNPLVQGQPLIFDVQRPVGNEECHVIKINENEELFCKLPRRWNSLVSDVHKLKLVVILPQQARQAKHIHN